MHPTPAGHAACGSSARSLMKISVDCLAHQCPSERGTARPLERPGPWPTLLLPSQVVELVRVKRWGSNLEVDQNRPAGLGY